MFFVFDVESIPDTRLIGQVLERPEVPEDELLESASQELTKGGSTFFPPMFHQMVSWAGLWIEDNGKPVREDAWSGNDEKQGLQKLFDQMNTYKDFGLIHHNGRGFDLPLLTYRAMRHELQMPVRLGQHAIRYRYSRENIDLMDEFSNYGASSYPKLKYLGHLMNIPFKKTAEGSEVYALFKRGELEQIQTYCHEDVIATYLVWLSFKFTTGEIAKTSYINLKERALQKLKSLQELQDAGDAEVSGVTEVSEEAEEAEVSGETEVTGVTDEAGKAEMTGVTREAGEAGLSQQGVHSSDKGEL
ncbi:MAG: hypothetical protein DA446_01420 [Bacteroidetes bacterium]|nr:MAG: hypothetical protein DA446_01420 [Bacteroidota bacterium]